MSNYNIDERGNLIIENGQLVFKNFSGEGGKYNHPGDRNFCVYIDDLELVDRLNGEGWRVKIRQPRDEGEPVRHYLKVNVSYKFGGPKVFRVINRQPFECFEDTIGELDKDVILSADLVVAPSHWENNGESGISGYLRSMYATIETDPFYDKYNTQMDMSAPAEFPIGTK